MASRFLADENLNRRIVTGLRRLTASLDIVRFRMWG